MAVGHRVSGAVASLKAGRCYAKLGAGGGAFRRASHFRFRMPLQSAGSGTGKRIKYRARNAIKQRDPAHQAEALRLGELGVGFVNGQRVPPGLEGFRYRVEPFTLCLPEGHPAASWRHIGEAELGRLQHESFLLFSRKVSPDYFESVIAICLAAGFLPKVRSELRQWLTVIAMVASGAGVALVPASLEKSRLPGVAFKPLEPFSRIRSETWCVWAAGGGDALRQLFVEEVRKHAHTEPAG